jgi:type I restriction enzyme R subunit
MLINNQGLLGVFDDADANKVISLVDRINGNALVAGASERAEGNG